MTAANLLSAFETRPSTIDPWKPVLNNPQTTNYCCSTVHVLGARGDRDTLRSLVTYYDVLQGSTTFVTDSVAWKHLYELGIYRAHVWIELLTCVCPILRRSIQKQVLTHSPYSIASHVMLRTVLRATSRSNRPPRTPFSFFAARGSLLGSHFRESSENALLGT